MASILDSFKGVFTDSLSFFKILVLSIPVYYSYQLYSQPNRDSSYFWLVAGLTLFFLFGFLIRVTDNVINEGSKVLPAINPFKFALSALKGIISIGPVSLISCLLANYLCSFIKIVLWLDLLLKSVVWLVTVAIIMTSFLLFANSEKIFDAFNLKLIFEKAGDLIGVILKFIIELICINAVTVGFICYVISILFGYGVIFYFFVSLMLVFNIGVFGHYWGQVHYDILGYRNPN